MGKRENDLIQYHQLNIEVSQAISLTPFLEEARDGAGGALVTGNGKLFKQVLGKQEDLERKKKQLDKLELSMNIRGCHTKRTEALESGKKLLASRKLSQIRQDIEMLSFSISQRVKNIDQLAG